MADDRYGSSTRRRFLTSGGVATGLFLAGCTTTQNDDGSGPGEESDGSNESNDSNESDESTDSESTDGSYSVSIEPVGEVTFDEVPETWFPYTGDYADMGVALGQGDGLLAVGIRERFASHYYEELPGVAVDNEELTPLWDGSKTDPELFYELDADVHVIDPNFMINRIEWSQDDIDEIEESVAPFFGSTIFSGSYGWNEYEQYTLYEAFEKLARVFQEEERYEAFETLHDEVLEDLQSQLPGDSLEVAILFPTSEQPESFYPYVMDWGSSFKQWRDLGVEDALAQSDVQNFHETRGEIDYETLLEVDPEAIAIQQHGEVTREGFESGIVSYMEDHGVASGLQAVQNDRVVRGGAPYQGPIVHLFQLEQAARGLHPDTFDEELFDRQRVADIVTGDF